MARQMTESAYDLLGIRKDFPKELARRADEVVDPELDVRLGGRIRELSKMAGEQEGVSPDAPGSDGGALDGAGADGEKFAAEFRFSPRHRRRIAGPGV